jgi:hypothetical protein
MTTWPSNQPTDQWSTPTTRMRIAAPDVPTAATYLPPTTAARYEPPTVAGYAPPTVATPAVAQSAQTARTSSRQAYVPEQLAWSDESEFAPSQRSEAAPAPQADPTQRFFTRSRVLALAAGGLVAAAAVGLFAALGDGSSTAVDTSNHPSGEFSQAEPRSADESCIGSANQPSGTVPASAVVLVGPAQQRSTVAVRSRRHIASLEVEPAEPVGPEQYLQARSSAR